MSSTDYSNEKVKPQQKLKRDQVIICEFLRNEIIKKQLHVSEIYYQKKSNLLCTFDCTYTSIIFQLEYEKSLLECNTRR